LNALSEVIVEIEVANTSLTIIDNMGNRDEFCFHHTRISNFSSASTTDSS